MLPATLAGAILAACACGAAAAQELPSTSACGGKEVARGRVRRVEDGRNFVLGNGREVDLAGIEVPQPAAAPGAAEAKSALAALFAGAQAVLHRAQDGTDRYGRIVAYVDALRGTTKRLVQAELLAEGLARLGDFVGGRECVAALLRRERAARTAKLGLWASPYYAILQADKPATVLAQRGRFALVEGKVVSVHQSGATLYINFGRDWSNDFTITIRKRNKRRFAAAGLTLADLSGQRIRVRGWVERRGGRFGAPWRGPTIEATHPEQIEAGDLR